ncbi:MAG: transcription antitermination factor NusB [Clostridia bacterium]|nr:transcription antitermination factor NusB [Clostridia bacterium]
MSRKNAREKAYQILFGLKSFDNDEQWQTSLSEMQKEWNLDDEDISFAKDICFGVVKNFESLKQILEKNLKGYSFEKLYRSDRTILLIALYELNHTTTPQKVVINEAVEISKKYGIEKSPKFVNGVLSGAIK